VTCEKIILDKTFFDNQKKFTLELFKTGRINNIKTAVLRKDGKIIPVEENIFLMYDKKGEIFASAAIIRDITEREKTEQELRKHRDNLDELVEERTKKLEEREHQLREVYFRLVSNDNEIKSANEQLKASNQQLRESEISLRESEKSFRRLVETMNEGLVVMNNEGEISYVNEKICVMTGYARDELQGSSIDDFLEKEDQKSEAVMKAILSESGSGNITSYEVEWIKKDKNKMSVIISPKPIIDDGDNFAGNFAVITDITAIKEAENSVRESRDFLENIFRTTRDGIVVTDTTGKIIRINDSVERLFGFTKHEMLGKDLSEIMPEGKEYREVGKNFSKELKSKGFFDISETYFRKKSGEIAPFECNISLVKNSEDQVTAAVAMLRDITERKEMEQQFLRAEKLSSIGELAGGVAHDFNNVLAAILGRAQLLMRTIEKAKENKDIEKLFKEINESLKIIERASLDGADTVKRIMKFAREEKEGEFTAINCIDILNDAIEFTRPRWKNQSQARGISIEIIRDFPSPILYVAGNGSELREVITNILNNAFDAMPDGGDILVRAAREDDSVVIELSDTGKGIDKEEIDKIFDPFFTTKGPKATGLGMSVSYGIIKQHGGTISVNSVKGEKTTFTISFPLYEDTVLKKEIFEAVTAQGKINVLVIEDEKPVCEVLEEILISEGHNIYTVCDGEQGIDVFRKKKFDLVITDLAMPGMTGWQVAKEIKKIDKNMPVILTTGWELMSSEEESDKKNVDIIVKKPFTVNSLTKAIREVLKENKAC
jgi:PAS domain S-box-containing protein